MNHSTREHLFKRFLVTGGAGFIGAEMVRQLVSLGKDVVVLDLDRQVERMQDELPKGIDVVRGSVLDKSAVREAMSGVDAVIHLAAVLGVKNSEQNKLYTLDVNVNGTQNVIETAIAHRVQKLTFASSSEVYGEPFETPVKETTPTQGKTVYAVSKLMGEELVKAYHQKYPQLAYTITRYFNTYGPHQVGQFVLTKFIRAAMLDEAMLINGDGSQQRSYCYVEDACRGTIAATMRTCADGEVFNIGNSKQPWTLLDVAKLVIKLAGKEGKVEPVLDYEFARGDRERSREIFRRFCNTAKAKELLDFEPTIPLEEGVARIIASGAPIADWRAIRFRS